MWILPTRLRPHNLARFFKVYAETQATQSGVVYVDDDDRTLDAYRKVALPWNWNMVVSPRIGLGPTINKAFTDNPDEPFYGCVTDDSVPVTPKWDVLMSEESMPDGIAYCANVENNPAQFGHFCMGGDLARDLGWLMLPGLIRIYGEDVLLAVGRKRKCLRYMPKCVIDHWHFSNGKAPMDETYQKPEKPQDKRIYEAWKNSFAAA